jgi:hypothetical protein
MNTLKGVSFVLMTTILLSVSACNNTVGSASNITKDSTAGPGFALLELYTSEGCSSCPPADRLLARIQKEAGTRPVYVLCEHVDYWDNQGWKDMFSQHGFSQRQYRYDNLLKAQVYTPQLIINGKSECLGSDERAVYSAVKNAVKTKTNVTLNLKAIQQGKGMEISYDVNGNSPEDQLMIAVVQKHAVNKIGDGENRGRTLEHAQIVRSLFSFSISTNNKGIEQISLPDNYNAAGYEIVGFIQDQKTNEIVDAVRANEGVSFNTGFLTSILHDRL